MKTFFAHLFRLALIVGLAWWLADRPGTARIVWHDYVIETSAALLMLGVVLLAYIFYLLLRLWNLLRYGPERWRLRKKLKNVENGHNYLTQGFIALAGGHAAEAGRLAVRARKTLGATPMTQLLQAQTAQLVGDRTSAREIYRTLAAEPSNAALGYRGLIAEARRDQDWTQVAALAEKLKAAQPESPYLHLVHFETAARRQDWDAALEELNRAAKASLLEPARLRKARAALYVALAQRDAQQSLFDKALSYAEQAIRLTPEWPPAIINLAQSQFGAGHQRAANRTVEKHWQRGQHPQLAEIYAAGEKTPLDSYKKLEKLCANDDSPAAHQTLGDAALRANIWGEARRYLMALISSNQATAATYRLLATLERRENGDDLAASRWLTKASEAAHDPVWLCENCGGSHGAWRATCTHCGSFNTLEWQSPGRSRTKHMTALGPSRADEV